MRRKSRLPHHKSRDFLRVVTYNIVAGGGNNLNMVLRNVEQMRVDLGLLTETKFDHDKHTKECCGCTVVATKAKSHFQGGVALFYRTESDKWSVEGARKHGPNVISCTLVSGHRRWTLIGACTPPSEEDGETLEFVAEAIHARGGHPLIFLGDINADFLNPVDDRAEAIVDSLAMHGLEELSNYFEKPRGRWTWSQSREG